MSERFSRTEQLIGSDAVAALAGKRVAVFGVGGVGGYAVEALARSGVGQLSLIDSDRVAESNINRQIIALSSTVGKLKVEVAAERARDINPDIKVNTYPIFYSAETADMLDFSQLDYVIDAIDSVSGKLELIMRANEAGVPVISAMGAGNKLDATAFEVADIYKTSVCPLARVMRHELKKRGIKKLKVVYSKEQPITQNAENGERPAPASIAFVPSVAGLILAGEVIKDLIK